MALLLQPSPKTLSPQPQAPDRSPQRTNQRARYLQLGQLREERQQPPMEELGRLAMGPVAGPVGDQHLARAREDLGRALEGRGTDEVGCAADDQRRL